MEWKNSSKNYVAKEFIHASSLLEAFGLYPPGNQGKPKETLSTANLLAQFDTTDIEPEWKEEYIKLIIDNWEVFYLWTSM